MNRYLNIVCFSMCIRVYVSTTKPYIHTHTHTHTDRYNSKSMGGGRGLGGGGVEDLTIFAIAWFSKPKLHEPIAYTHTHKCIHFTYSSEINNN